MFSEVFYKFGDKVVFKIFGISHIIALSILVVSIVAFVIFLRHTDSRNNTVIRYILFAVMLCLLVSQYIWLIVTGNFIWSKNLPITMCGVTSILCMIELFVKNKGYSFNEDTKRNVMIYNNIYNEICADRPVIIYMDAWNFTSKGTTALHYAVAYGAGQCNGNLF